MATFASSWKKQSSRLKTGNTNLVTNDTVYGENVTFNHFVCNVAYLNDICSNICKVNDLSANNVFLDKALINDLHITNLGQSDAENDRWLNVDTSNGIYIVDLSVNGNYTKFGGHSMMKNTSAWGTSAYGYDALRNISTATDISFANTAVGTGAMCGNNGTAITGYKNSALGFDALRNISTGFNNSAFGFEALKSNTTGENNTAVGMASLQLNTTGIFNIGIGVNSILNNTTGTHNSAIGGNSLNANTTGSNNIAVGHLSLGANQIGYNNVAVGYNSAYHNIDASANTAIGANSLFSNQKGINNVAVGYNTLYTDVSGVGNTVVGTSSDTLGTMVSFNQMLGYNNKSEYDNVNIIGTNITSTGANRTFISNIGSTSAVVANNVMAYDSATNELTASSKLKMLNGNFGINTTGSPEYHLDVYDSATDLSYVIARFKSEGAPTGTSKTFIRIDKGDTNGYGAAYGGFITQGVGSGAVIHAVNNGVYSGNNIQVSNTNIVIDCSYNGSDSLVIPHIGTGTVYSNAGVISNVGPSDASMKKNIVGLMGGDGSAYEKMMRLNPVQYEWLNSYMGGGVKYGFLANEVRELFPEIVSTIKDISGNDKLGFDIVSLIPIVTVGVLKQGEEIAQLKKENAELRSEISKLYSLIEARL